MAAGEELIWLSDYVISVVKSPTWVTPIAQFVDERCIIFEENEENNLDQTQCHNDFRLLVDDLLAAHLLEVSVTPEQFDQFCESGFAPHHQLHRTLIEQLLSVEDFLTFKAMMAKHNAELSREVVTLECDVEDDDYATPAEEVVAHSIVDGLCGDWQLYDTHLFKAEAGDDDEAAEAQRRIEEAELERAIALSLQVEEERLRLLAEAAANGAEETLPAAPAPLPPSAGFTSAPLCPLPAKPKVPEAAPEAHLMKLERLGSTLKKGIDAPAETLQLPAAVGFTSSPLCFKPPTLNTTASSLGATLGRTASVQSTAIAEQEPETKVEGMAANLQLWRERAEQVITAPPNPISPRQVEQAKKQQPTDEERRARAEHLRKQRDRLIQKRNRERDQQLASFGRKAQVDAASKEDRAAAGRRVVAELTPGVQVASAAAPPLPDAAAAAEKMRRALTLQLRQTFLVSTAGDAGVLDAQLNRLEMLKLRG